LGQRLGPNHAQGQNLGPNHSQGPIHGPHAPKDQSPITRGMLERIQMGLFQQDQIHHGLHMLFLWAKEYILI